MSWGLRIGDLSLSITVSWTNDTAVVSLCSRILLQAGILPCVADDYSCPSVAYATYVILYGHRELIFLLALFNDYKVSLNKEKNKFDQSHQIREIFNQTTAVLQKILATFLHHHKPKRREQGNCIYGITRTT